LKDVVVEPDMGDAHYKGMLRKHSGDDEGLLALPAPVIPPAPLPIEDGVADEFDGVHIPEGKAKRRRIAKAVAAPKVLALPAPPTPPAGVSPAHSSSSSSSDDDGASAHSSVASFDIGLGRSAVGDWIEMDVPDCPAMKRDKYKPKGKVAYTRFIARCSHHEGCQKKRSAAMTHTHGDIEPVGFLAAWHAMGEHLDLATHGSRHLKVPADDVAIWCARIGVHAMPLLVE
jgi:hypothetical protein